MSLRSKHHRQDRVNRLHLTALDHISREGVQGLRLGAVAKELGYTTAALYRYYPSRDSLILELQRQTLTLLHESLFVFLEEIKLLTPIGKLLLCTQYYSLYAERSPASFALNSSLFANPTTMLEQVKRRETMRVIGHLLSILSDLITEAKLSLSQPALSLAVGYWSTLYGALMTRKYQNELTLLEPTELILALFIGWGASRDQITQAREEAKIWGTLLHSEKLSRLTELDHLNIS